MKADFWKLFFVSGFICFVMNIVKHNSWLVIVANTALFLGYLNLFKETMRSRSTLFLQPFLAFMPIFVFDHLYYQIYCIEALVLLSWYFLDKISPKYLFLAGAGVFLLYFYFTLMSNHLLKWPFRFETEQLIYPQHLYQLEIDRQQKEAMYLPYRLRFLTFNELSSYGYVLVGNIFSFFSLENLYRTVLLVNTFFGIIGLFFVNKLKPYLKFLVPTTLIISLIAAGMIKTPDSMRPLSSLRGILLFLTINGFTNKPKWVYYLGLFGLSLLMNIV